MVENHTEIERSWILKSLPNEDLIEKNIPHEIAYLISGFVGELRIVKRLHKKSNGMPSDCEKYSITVKGGQSGLSRPEWEDDNFPAWGFDILWQSKKSVIKKTRYFVPDGKHLLEIDVYHKRGKISNHTNDFEWCSDIAGNIRVECEFSSEEEANAYTLPEWAKGSKEITGMVEFRNRVLASQGWPDWLNLSSLGN